MKYYVHGIAFVPVEVAQVVDATSEEDTMKVAKVAWTSNKHRRRFSVIGNSEDYNAVFDWEPSEARAATPKEIQFAAYLT